MLDLLLLPFHIVFKVMGAVFSFIGGMFSMIFGLLGGLVHLAFSIGGLVLVISLIAVAIRRRHPSGRDDDPREDDFISYYDKNAVK